MKPYQVVILAGGFATRLYPITKKIPKALIQVHHKPFLAYQLQKLKKEGIREVFLCVGHLGKQIEEYVGDGSLFGLTIRLFDDGQRLLGTAGAIRQILEHLDENFFVMYGDSYLLCPFISIQQAHIKSNKQALMVVYRNQGLYDRSNVEFDGRNILKYSKKALTPNMQHIDYGLGAFNRDSFQVLPKGSVADLADLYEELLSRDQLAGQEVVERFYEIGSLSGIEAFKQLWEPAR